MKPLTIYALQRMITNDLTAEERELAACTSYAYWAWSKLQQQQGEDSSHDGNGQTAGTTTTAASAFQTTMAMKEARRHFLGEDRDYASALDKLKACLAWRKVRLVHYSQRLQHILSSVTLTPYSCHCYQSERIDLLRVCFQRKTRDISDSSSTIISIPLSENENTRCMYWEGLLARDMEAQVCSF